MLRSEQALRLVPTLVRRLDARLPPPASITDRGDEASHMERRYHELNSSDAALNSPSSLLPPADTLTDADTERGHDHLGPFQTKQPGAVTWDLLKESNPVPLGPLPSAKNTSGIENRVIHPRSEQSENLLGADGGRQLSNTPVSESQISETRSTEADINLDVRSLRLSTTVATSSNARADTDVRRGYDKQLSLFPEPSRDHYPTIGVNSNNEHRSRPKTLISDTQDQYSSADNYAAQHPRLDSMSGEMIRRANTRWLGTRGKIRHRDGDGSTQSPPLADSNASVPSISTSIDITPITHVIAPIIHGATSSTISLSRFPTHMRPPMANIAPAPALSPPADGDDNDDLKATSDNYDTHDYNDEHTHNNDHDILHDSERFSQYPYSSSYVSQRVPLHLAPSVPPHVVEVPSNEQNTILGKIVTISIHTLRTIC